MKKLFLFPIAFVLMSCQGSDGNVGFSQYDMAGDLSPQDYEDLIEEESTQSSDLYNMFNSGSEGDYEFEPTDDKKEKASNTQQAFADNDRQTEDQKTAALQKNNQKIIRTATMEMEVEQYDTARVALNKIITRFDARIEKEAESRHSYRVQSQFAIRVAPEKLDDLINAIIEIGIDVDNKSINSRNVTRQYVDLETRLATKRAVIKRYRNILTTARSIEDILNVEEHLRRVVEEVESMEGQLRVLKDQVGESTLNLMIYESFERPNVKKKTFWNRMGKALSNGWRGGQEFLIGLVSLWPFWIIAGGLFWFIRSTLRRRKKLKS